MRGLLIRGLRPRRHQLRCAWLRTGGAIADRENVRVERRLKRLMHDELIDPVRLQPVELSQHLRGFDTCRPYHQLRGDERAVGEAEAASRYLGHLCAGADLDTDLVEQTLRLVGDAFGQGWEDPLRCFDQRDASIPL